MRAAVLHVAETLEASSGTFQDYQASGVQSRVAGLALGGAALLFPQEIQNLTSGIKETIGGFLADVAAVPDTAFGAKQEVYLKIGDGEIRDITDIQDEMRQEARL